MIVLLFLGLLLLLQGSIRKITFSKINRIYMIFLLITEQYLYIQIIYLGVTKLKSEHLKEWRVSENAN